MEQANPFEIDFESYIRQVEPGKKEKGESWAIANGFKEWRYLFIPSLQGQESSSFKNLAQRFVFE